MRKKILLVDDSRTAVLLCAVAISRQRPDFIFLEATSGASALEVVLEQVPDFAILDVNMPEMDGIDLARCLRTQFPQLPICLLTAKDVQAAARRRAEELNVLIFGKPVTEIVIREMLTQMAA